MQEKMPIGSAADFLLHKAPFMTRATTEEADYPEDRERLEAVLIESLPR